MLEAFRGRDSWLPPEYQKLKNDYERQPVCAVSKRHFPPWYQSLDVPRWNQYLSSDMSRCDSFTQFVSGLSIKDHKEMLDRQRWLDWQKEMRQMELDQRDRDQAWQQYMASDERTWRRDERESQNKWQRDQLRTHRIEIGVLFFGIIVAAIVAVFVGYMFSDDEDVTPLPAAPVATATVSEQ
jgi:hypothetical protein